ncbi:hypothetical protein [Dermatophilus congolensis]|uniref:Uncharacterized protein n=1 Tax=Dermatophilus congolensis TaxID=1863 RepID=A0A239V592_9MICO|nr:hypothetical protein [Dermatophilus congolensis]MBO3215841.1 hypothetical protein [Dermatophilus congolensis]SNV17242.1 Uncharacterised protein [Dermatophilus congolensis]
MKALPIVAGCLTAAALATTVIMTAPTPHTPAETPTTTTENTPTHANEKTTLPQKPAFTSAPSLGTVEEYLSRSVEENAQLISQLSKEQREALNKEIDQQNAKNTQ